MDNKRFLRDPQMRATDIASRIAPKMVSWPVNTEYVHWTRIVSAAEESRARLSAYFDARDEIEADPRLTRKGKQEERKKAAEKALLGFAKSKALSRAEESVGAVMAKWEAKVREVIRPAASEAETALHGEIRRHVAGLKDEHQRLSFLEQHAHDPRLAAALLEAPRFLSGLTDAEQSLITHKIEAQALPPEVAQAKIDVRKAMGETLHGWERGQALIAEDAGLSRAADGSWTQPANADAA